MPVSAPSPRSYIVGCYIVIEYIVMLPPGCFAHAFGAEDATYSMPGSCHLCYPHLSVSMLVHVRI